MTFPPSDQRSPGVYSREQLQRSRGLSTLPLRIALVGYRSSAADASRDNQSIRLQSRAEAQSFYESGSVLDLMARASFDVGSIARSDQTPGGTPEVYAIAVAPPDTGGDQAAVFTLTLSGAPTAQGSLDLEVGDQAVSVGVLPDDTITTIAARANDVYALLEPDLPATFSAALGVLTVTVREKGEHGNDVFIRADATNAPGISVVVAQSAVGVGVVSLDDALDASLAIDLLGAVAVCQDDAASITALSAHIETAWQYDEDRPVMGVMGATGDISNATAIAAALDRYRIVVTSAEKVVGVGVPYDPAVSARSMAFAVAAGAAARLYSQTKPNYNFNRARIPGKGRPGRIPSSVVNAATNAGVCLVLDDGDGARFDRPVSTAITDQSGQTLAPDLRWQPVEVVRTVQALWNQGRIVLGRFVAADQTQETVTDATTSTLTMLRTAAARENRWIGSVEDSDVVVRFETAGPSTRIVVDAQYVVLPGVDIVAITYQVFR